MNLIDISRRSIAIQLLLLLIAVIAGSWLTITYIGLIQSLFNSLNTFASFVSAGATGILVLVTAVYVLTTWSLVRETREAREQEVMPVMKLELESHIIGGLSPAIKNIGNGPAMGIEGVLQLKPMGEEFEISSKNLAPGESTVYIQPIVPTETDEGFSELTVRGEYTNVFGKSESFTDDYNLELLSETSEFHPFTEQDRKLKHLSGIEENLGSIAEEIEGLEKLLTYNTRQIVIDTLQEEGSLSYRELAYETGLSLSELGVILSYMKGFGLVNYSIETDSLIDSENKDVLIRLPSSE